MQAKEEGSFRRQSVVPAGTIARVKYGTMRAMRSSRSEVSFFSVRCRKPVPWVGLGGSVVM